jgi:hypothetical protein
MSPGDPALHELHRSPLLCHAQRKSERMKHSDVGNHLQPIARELPNTGLLGHQSSHASKVQRSLPRVYLRVAVPQLRCWLSRRTGLPRIPILGTWVNKVEGKAAS